VFVLTVVFNSSAVTQTLLNSGSVTINLMATSQALDNAVTSDKTNNNSSGTVVTTLSKSTVSNSFVQSADILNLLENSFNTTLPEGAQLVMSRSGSYLDLFVTDSTETNTVMSLGGVLFLGTIVGEQPVH